jgi:phosphopantothenoylcysteine decarboxylase / phosphopantothenate---cysteine ligase
MPRILLGVSGGIAAYKALEFVRLATAAGHHVRVIQTPTSLRFVGSASFAALTGAPVLRDEFELDPSRGAFPDQQPPQHTPLSHLEIVRNAEVYLIAPASANTLAKLAHGLADNLLCSAALAAGTCPVIVAPAMNNHMYEHPATQANLKLLRSRGVKVIDPGVGRLASKGEQGTGRLAEPAELLKACEASLTGEPGRVRAWRGLRVLVTAGGTREPIDSVRFIGNSSSGRMGLALAQAASDRGAEVTLIAANITLPIAPGIRCLRVGSAAQLREICQEEFPACDILMMAAAVADFTPSAPKDGKIKKSQRERLELQLEPTEDILACLSASRREGQTLIGFAAEHGHQAVQCGQQKLTGKGLDAVVVNDISRADIGFDSDSNEVTILMLAKDAEAGQSKIDRLDVPRASKANVAEAILDAVEGLRAVG